MSRALAWVRRWGVSVASLAGGLLTLLVFRRGLPKVAWIVGYLLLLWLLFAVLTQLRHDLEAKGHRLVVTAADYAVQSLYHALLLFVLPAYWASTTLTSPNALFLAVLVALALLATFDPWYRAIVHPRPWLGHLFFVVSIFAALDVALPLVGVPPMGALLISAWLSVIALTPAVQRAREWSWAAALAVTAGGAVGAMPLVAMARIAIPPAPVSLAEGVVARDVGDGGPRDPVRSISAEALRESGLVAYTAIYAPSGLRQPIQHVWRRGGDVVESVRLSPVFGGRERGFRTYSRKTAFPDRVIGRWTVDVMTGSGQLIGRLRFQVTP